MPKILSPAVNVQIKSGQVVATTLGQTDVTFLPVVSERGPIEPTVVTSAQAYAALFGGRHSGHEASYDHVEAITSGSGGRPVVVTRVVGPASKTATVTLNETDGSTPVLKVTAHSIGAWGNRVKLTVKNDSGGGTQTVTVLDGDQVLHRWTVTNITDVHTAAQRSDVIDTQILGSNPSAKLKEVENQALAGGADDNNNITIEHVQKALNQLDQSWGPGQILAPLWTSEQAHKMLLVHAAETNRVALLDLPIATSLASETVTSWAEARNKVAELLVDGEDMSWRGAMFPVWVNLRPFGRGDVIARKVPGSVFAAAVISRNTANIGVNEQPIATNGYAAEGVFTGQVIPVSAIDRDKITNAHQLNVPFTDRNGTRLYGFRSVTKNPLWQGFNKGRFAMLLADEIGDRGESFIGRNPSKTNMTLLENEAKALLDEHIKKGNLDAYKVAVNKETTPDGVIGFNCAVSCLFGEAVEFVVFTVTNQGNA